MTLICGEHVIGEVTDYDFENWHNYGKLQPGPDSAAYRPLLDDYARLDALIEADVDAEDDAARDARDALQDRFDALGLRLVTRVGAQVIHDFHPTDDDGGVYWRWGEPRGQGEPPHNQPLQRTGAAGMLTRIRTWLGRGPGR